MQKAVAVVRKTLIGLSVLGLAASATVAGGAGYWFYRSAPVYRGQATVAGLSAPVDVWRDRYGVPHIFAANWNDAARALGYVHADERLFQMEMQRRAGQGRLSELLGADMIGVDQFTRTLGLYKLAQSSFTALSPDAQAFFRAYAAGVNDWLATHKNNLPPEFILLHDAPEPWQPADSIVWQKLMALELSSNYHMELLRAALAKTMPPQQLPWLFPMPPVGAPVTMQPAPLPQGQAQNADEKLGALLGLDHAASNEWVIGGAHTATGKPLLANDPHLGLEAPILWYLARMVIAEKNCSGGSVEGATVPGLPIVLLGQNDHMAWGFTTTGSDVEDLFIETLDPKNPDKYLTPQGSDFLTTRSEIIHVKGAADVVLHIRATRHGPVMSDVSPDIAALAGQGQVVALAFTGLGDQDTTAEALLRIDRAHNAAEFLEALKLYQAPPQNIVYADDSGAFGFINPGLVPVRKHGDGLMPADGASGDNDWAGTVPFDRLPHIANAAAGYVFNANNAVVGAASADYFGQDWEEPYRARRLQQIFDHSIGAFTMAQMAAMQADHLSLAARDFLPLLLALKPQDARGQQALTMLRGWDGMMDAARPQPVIFEAWLYEFHHKMFAKTGVDMSAKGPFAAMTLMSLVKNHARDWCGDDDCGTMMRQSLADALTLMTQRQGADMKQWRWGRENVARLRHQFYSHIPVLDALSDLSVESSGDFYTLDRGGGFDNDVAYPFARTHGGGFRGLYDLSNPAASRFMIATGESGHILSRHYGDLVSRWNQAQSIPLTGSESQLRQGGADELILEPR